MNELVRPTTLLFKTKPMFGSLDKRPVIGYGKTSSDVFVIVSVNHGLHPVKVCRRSSSNCEYDDQKTTHDTVFLENPKQRVVLVCDLPCLLSYFNLATCVQYYHRKSNNGLSYFTGLKLKPTRGHMLLSGGEHSRGFMVQIMLPNITVPSLWVTVTCITEESESW
ncbi:hypothetical protein J6590_052748 [Homalodisca vitripennis]|nr:hypothetical protein J6590_052748 [Homalodisca vitripennis]